MFVLVLFAKSFGQWQVCRMGSIRLQSLSDYATHGYIVRIDCQCGRTVRLEPLDLMRIIAAKQWPRYSMDAIARRFRCKQCGSRPRRIGPGVEPP